MAHSQNDWILDVVTKPWCVYEDDDLGRTIFMAGGPHLKPRPDEETIANLRLGAAAPKMLEALGSLLNIYRSATCNHPDDAVRAAAIEQAEAAIAAAKGEGL